MSREKKRKHRSGFVNIIGNPNVGKSTLMNSLVGERLSIVTSKAQTTRHRIMGIVNGEDYQIVYSDTPGILKAGYTLQKSMMSFVKGAIGDADILLYVTDVVESGEKNREYLEILNSMETPILLAINKIDLSNGEEVERLYLKWSELLPKAKIFPISAQEKFNLEPLFNSILERLPLSPPWFGKELFTDKNLRFFASEIIREKIFINYSQEIPYSSEVVIEQFKEEGELYKIDAVIYVTRESQKPIIIGKGGAALKKMATQARVEMESFFEKRVFLQIFVKVNPNWREDSAKLKELGYIQE